MIKLYRSSDDAKADEIENRFNDLVLSYEAVISDYESGDLKLPSIQDGDRIVSGDQEIEQWLRELEADLKWERSLSGDGCYIDPNSGKVC